VNNKLFKASKVGKQAQNGLVPLGVTQGVTPKNYRIKWGAINEDVNPFYKLLTTMFERVFTASISVHG
jgi:hypothetical protein